MKAKFHVGEKYYLSGDSKDMWINGYNVRVDSECTVLEEPGPRDKKVYVSIDEIDGDRNVCCKVKINSLM